MAIEGYRWGHSRRHSEDIREVWRGGLGGHGRGHRWVIERDIGRVTGLGIGGTLEGFVV